MADTGPPHNLRYPILTDAPNVPLDVQNLAEDTDGRLDVADGRLDALEAVPPHITRIATIRQALNSTGSAAEVVRLTVVAPVVFDRIYLVRAYVGVASTVDNDDATLRIREDSLTGNQLQEAGLELNHDLQSTRGQPQAIEVEYTASATENKTFVLTTERAAGTGAIRLAAASNKPSYLYVDYIRDA